MKDVFFSREISVLLDLIGQQSSQFIMYSRNIGDNTITNALNELALIDWYGAIRNNQYSL